VNVIYLVAFVVLVLATARLTRLIHFDDLTLSMRNWIDRRFGERSILSRIVWCPWCASVWAAIITCPFAMAGLWLWAQWSLWGALWATGPLILAVSYPAGWIVHKETTATSRGE
jgi:hypothetical protein